MRLLDVVPVRQEVDLREDRFVACSVELWDSAIVAQSTVFGPAMPAGSEAIDSHRATAYLLGMRLRDDVGTTYRRAGGGCGGGLSDDGLPMWSGHARFEPAVPATARRLWLGIGATRVELEVDLRSEA